MCASMFSKRRKRRNPAPPRKSTVVKQFEPTRRCVHISTMTDAAKKTTYAELGLESRLFKAVARMGFVHPTVIQVRV